MSKIKVALAQYPIKKHKSLQAWIQSSEEWVQNAKAANAEICIFPEYGSIELTGFASEDVQASLPAQIRYLTNLRDLFVQHYLSLSKKYGLYIVAPSLPVQVEGPFILNRVYVLSPSGKVEHQDKIYMTRFEDEHWGIQSAKALGKTAQQKIFKTQNFSFSIATCFDVEFPFASMLAAKNGADLIIAPSCTETVQGMNRVHIGARARALENQIYVVVAQTVGEALWSLATDVNTGKAAAYGPPDLGFPVDGILMEGQLNQEGWIFCDLDFTLIQDVRRHGAVFNFKNMSNHELQTDIVPEIISLF